MFSLIKQVFIVLLSFSSPLASKYMSLNDEPCIARPTLIDLNQKYGQILAKNMCSN